MSNFDQRFEQYRTDAQLIQNYNLLFKDCNAAGRIFTRPKFYSYPKSIAA